MSTTESRPVSTHTRYADAQQADPSEDQLDDELDDELDTELEDQLDDQLDYPLLDDQLGDQLEDQSEDQSADQPEKKLPIEPDGSLYSADRHPDTAPPCEMLQSLNRRRLRYIGDFNKTFARNVQHGIYELEQLLPEDHGIDRKAMYARCERILRTTMSLVDVENKKTKKMNKWAEREAVHTAPVDDVVGWEAATLPFRERWLREVAQRWPSGSHSDMDETAARVAARGLLRLDEVRNCKNTTKQQRKRYEERMSAAVMELPVYDWWISIRGLAAVGLGIIIGETGDLWRYKGPDKVKRRLGLAPWPRARDGVTRSGCEWRKLNKTSDRLTKADWTTFGYNQRRRSSIWQIGTNLVKQDYLDSDGDKRPGTYRQLYLDRKRREAVELIPAKGRIVVTSAAKTQQSWKALGLPDLPLVTKKQFDATIHCQAIVADRRAQRWMEQQFVIEMWARWVGKWTGRRLRC